VSAVVAIFAVVMGAALQALLPAWSGMGYAKTPILLGIVLYYALTRRRATALSIALLTGFFKDALSLSPLGCSALPFVLIAYVLNHYREEVFILHPITHVIFGAAAAMAADLLAALLLAASVPGANLGVSSVMARSLGSALLGAAATPLVYRLLWSLDLALGNVDRRVAQWR
jgi:rod shape-determining protein MreD